MTAPEWLARNTLPTPTSLCTVARPPSKFPHLLHERSPAAAAVAPRDGRVRLAEAFENGGESVLGNANTGVGHLDEQAIAGGRERYGQGATVASTAFSTSSTLEGRISTR